MLGFLRCMSPLLALSGHDVLHCKGLLFDPKWTSAPLFGPPFPERRFKPLRSLVLSLGEGNPVREFIALLGDEVAAWSN